jgi:Tfp pilus assembly protein PilN
MAITFSTINSPYSWDVQPFESLDAEGAARMLNRLQSQTEHMQREIDALKAERDALLAALREVVAISDRKHDAWDRAHNLIDGQAARP